MLQICLNLHIIIEIAASCVLYYILFFFFSSRRRHTRFDCDWSSDVCSSDLSCAGHWVGTLLIVRHNTEIHDVERVTSRIEARGHRTFQTPAADFSRWAVLDRKSTRLNSSHSQISYAVFCLIKKKPLITQLKI